MRDRKPSESYLNEIILSAPEDTAERIRKSQRALRDLKWIPAPASWYCPQCGCRLEKMTRILMPENAGAVRCKSCRFRCSTQYYLNMAGSNVVSTPDDKSSG